LLSHVHVHSSDIFSFFLSSFIIGLLLSPSRYGFLGCFSGRSVGVLSVNCYHIILAALFFLSYQKLGRSQGYVETRVTIYLLFIKIRFLVVVLWCQEFGGKEEGWEGG